MDLFVNSVKSTLSNTVAKQPLLKEGLDWKED